MIELTNTDSGEIIGSVRKDTSSWKETCDLIEKWSRCCQRGINLGKNLHLSVTYKPFPAYDKNFLDYLDKDKDKPF